MSTDPVIGMSPPGDGREWDCQCARCGSSIDRVRCDQCGGEGVDGHDCGEDSCCCLHPEDNMTCDICHGEGGWWRCLASHEWCRDSGEGGWWRCLASHEWCRDHPMPGREKYGSDTPEWFPAIQEPRDA